MSKGDAKGHFKGARGIDGAKDVGFQKKNVDARAVSNMYGRGWANTRIEQSGGDGDFTGESK